MFIITVTELGSTIFIPAFGGKWISQVIFHLYFILNLIQVLIFALYFIWMLIYGILSLLGRSQMNLGPIYVLGSNKY